MSACRCPRVDAYSSHFYPSIDRDNLSINLIDYYIDYYMKIVERIDCYRSDDVYIYIYGDIKEKIMNIEDGL